jgi:hypothetical protein
MIEKRRRRTGSASAPSTAAADSASRGVIEDTVSGVQQRLPAFGFVLFDEVVGTDPPIDRDQCVHHTDPLISVNT